MLPRLTAQVVESLGVMISTSGKKNKVGCIYINTIVLTRTAVDV